MRNPILETWMALLDITFIFAVPLLFLYFMLFHVVSINLDQFIPFVDNDTFIFLPA